MSDVSGYSDRDDESMDPSDDESMGPWSCTSSPQYFFENYDPDYTRNQSTSRVQTPVNYEDLSWPVVASGGFKFPYDQYSEEPLFVDKSFGLIKKDNSVLKFRIVVKLDKKPQNKC